MPVLICNFTQFNHNIDALPPLSTMAFIPEHQGIIYQKDGKIMKLDLMEFSNSEMKMRSSNIEGRNTIVGLFKILNDSFVVFSGDNCLRKVSLEDYKKVTIMGFCCPYCLQLFSTRQMLYRDHIHRHMGPVSCDTCEVDFIRKY